MNILCTAAGRRSYLVNYFRAALDGIGRVVCANSIADSPALLAADSAHLVRQSNQAGYIDEIIDICHQNDVKALFSFHDLDTLILSRHREEFIRHGVIPMVPDPYWAELTLDKYECSEKLLELGLSSPFSSISIPRVLEETACGRLHYPLLLKPRFGFASMGIETAHDKDELMLLHRRIAHQQEAFLHSGYLARDVPREESVLIQQKLTGRECRISIVHDLQGTPASVLALDVLAMRSGETDLAVTIDPLPFRALADRLGSASRHQGIWSVDFVQHDGVNDILDINPRFAGDYPFHHIAGADIPRAMISWLTGQTPDPAWLNAQPGVKGFKDLVPALMMAPATMNNRLSENRACGLGRGKCGAAG